MIRKMIRRARIRRKMGRSRKIHHGSETEIKMTKRRTVRMRSAAEAEIRESAAEAEIRERTERYITGARQRQK